MATPRAPARGRGTTGGPDAHVHFPASSRASASAAKPAGAPRRAVIERIRPLVDGGRFAAKAVVGDLVAVEADAFCDGHDLLACDLLHQRDGETTWTTAAMAPTGNDRWRGQFPVEKVGRYRFVVRAGVDRYATWLRDLFAFAEAGEDVAAELLVGSELLSRAAARARGTDRRALVAVAESLAGAPAGLGTPLSPGARRRVTDALGAPDAPGDGDGTISGVLRSAGFGAVVARHRLAQDATTSGPCPVLVEPVRARFSTWYELFPRSASPVPGRQGTLADAAARLDYLERLGVDVLYLPPVHPIGRTGRKGAEGTVDAAPDDPGSPWAIGAESGGHTAVDPALGTIEDFDALVRAASDRGIAVALDLAFQCSPDHPWVKEHPEWFKHRPDGTIRYAQNPPKRYEDIYPLDFESDSWWDLWRALREVVRFWIRHGVRVFRVDNPHTKPFDFWEWLLATVREDHPDTVFLSEAFTRPAVMYRLAKLGFSQSYTYFAWRNTKWEIESYMAELAQVSDFFRPNFWPNTPDILTEVLQSGGTPAFVARLVLASTLAANYGVYGPAYELQEHVARHAGSEEYAGSEKYSIRHWDLDRPDSLAPLMARLNEVRRSHPALQRDGALTFHATDNDQLLAYSKAWGEDAVLVIVNLDARWRQSGWVQLGPLSRGPGELVEVHDLLTDARYVWEGSQSFVILDPASVPAHVLAVVPDGD
jgi:starch synthase (maltosyl-transferring)